MLTRPKKRAKFLRDGECWRDVVASRKFGRKMKVTEEGAAGAGGGEGGRSISRLTAFRVGTTENWKFNLKWNRTLKD